MKSSIALLALAASSVTAFAPQQSVSKKSVTEIELTREEILSEPNNIEFGKVWDPLGLSELGGDETIAWFRHAEVKHGRVAMAAFVGWTAVAGAGIRFPGELSHGLEFASLPSKGLEAWDAVPGWGKAQLLLFAGLIEFHDELFYSKRGTHYMKGGIPGKVSNLLGICITAKIKLSRHESSIDNSLFAFNCHFCRTWFLVFTILSTCLLASPKKTWLAGAVSRSRTDV